MPMELPAPIARLAAELAQLPGAVAGVLGGSRASGAHGPASDWDLGLYYRGSQKTFDPAHLRGLAYDGHVSGLGKWGPVVNGGAWLTLDDSAVDVLYRDLDLVESWLDAAQRGSFEVFAQNGRRPPRPRSHVRGARAPR